MESPGIPGRFMQRELTRVGEGIERLVNAYQEELLSLEQLRERMPLLRQREQTLRAELQAIADQATDRAAFLRLAETLAAFLGRLRSAADTLDVIERQRIVRLVVKDILIGDDTIVIRHCIPIGLVPPPDSGPTTPGRAHDTSDGRSFLLRSGSTQPRLIKLANIYLDKLDQFVEQNMLPKYTRGDRRRPNPAWQRLQVCAKSLEKKGKKDEAKALRRQMQQLPSLDPIDPNYRRLRYLRYADDWLLGFSGPRNEAEEIKSEIGTYLHEHLKLELSETKTLITHARTAAARFLGYEIVTLHNDRKLDQRGHRSINGQIGLKVPTALCEKNASATSIAVNRFTAGN